MLTVTSMLLNKYDLKEIGLGQVLDTAAHLSLGSISVAAGHLKEFKADTDYIIQAAEEFVRILIEDKGETHDVSYTIDRIGKAEWWTYAKVPKAVIVEALEGGDLMNDHLFNKAVKA